MSNKATTLAFMYDRIAACAQILVDCDKESTKVWSEVARLAALGQVDKIDDTIRTITPSILRAGQAFDTMTRLIALATAIGGIHDAPVTARVAGTAEDLTVDANKLDLDGPLRASIGALSPELFAVILEGHRAQCSNPNCRVMAVMTERANAEAH